MTQIVPGATPCERETCRHGRVVHPRADACLVPGCGCESFVAPTAAPFEDPEHVHTWQPAGGLSPLNGLDYIAALCPCGAVARLQVPAEVANA